MQQVCSLRGYRDAHLGARTSTMSCYFRFSLPTVFTLSPLHMLSFSLNLNYSLFDPLNTQERCDVPNGQVGYCPLNRESSCAPRHAHLYHRHMEYISLQESDFSVV